MNVKVNLAPSVIASQLARWVEGRTLRHRPQLVGQRRLPRPGLAGHQHPAALARQRVGERGFQAVHGTYRHLQRAPASSRIRV
jgi:metallophosphoesterase superfamily enzyme